MSTEAPAAGSEAPATGSGLVGSESSASTTGGAAPAGGDAAVQAGAPAAEVAAAGPASAGFRFAGRQFNDLAHAENILKTELGKQRSVQRENSRLQNEMAEVRRQLETLRALVPGQGAVSQPKASDGPVSLAQELLKDGTLDVAAQMAENPEMGLRHAMYAVAEGIEKRMRAEIDQLKSGVIEPMVTRNQQEQAIARTFTAARNLAADFPELDDANHSPEAEEAQGAILETVKRFPPEMLAQDPGFVLLASALMYRHQNGTPVFAQPPGTSGSPSVRAAQAAEAAQAATAPVPLDGTGVPRPRPNGQPESFADRIRRENRESRDSVLKTPSGRMLGFGA